MDILYVCWVILVAVEEITKIELPEKFDEYDEARKQGLLKLK